VDFAPRDRSFVNNGPRLRRFQLNTATFEVRADHESSMDHDKEGTRTRTRAAEGVREIGTDPCACTTIVTADPTTLRRSDLRLMVE